MGSFPDDGPLRLGRCSMKQRISFHCYRGLESTKRVADIRTKDDTKRRGSKEVFTILRRAWLLSTDGSQDQGTKYISTLQVTLL